MNIEVVFSSKQVRLLPAIESKGLDELPSGGEVRAGGQIENHPSGLDPVSKAVVPVWIWGWTVDVREGGDPREVVKSIVRTPSHIDGQDPCYIIEANATCYLPAGS